MRTISKNASTVEGHSDHSCKISRAIRLGKLAELRFRGALLEPVNL
jgi:hypothetical protein